MNDPHEQINNELPAPAIEQPDSASEKTEPIASPAPISFAGLSPFKRILAIAFALALAFFTVLVEHVRRTKQFGFSTTTEYVINNCPCEVVIVSEQAHSRHEYRGLVYKTAKGTVNLRGQLGDKQSECLLPSVNQDCIYHINVTVGKIRFFHTAYNPDTRNWDLPPIPGQDVTLDIAAGEAKDILVKADSTDGKADRIRIVNRDMRKEAVFEFRITAAPENHEPAPAPEREKTPFEKRDTLEVPRTGIPANFEAPEIPTFIAEAKAEFDALEKEIADAAAAKEDLKASAETKVYDAASFADYLVDEVKSKEPADKSFKDSNTLFSVEIND